MDRFTAHLDRAWDYISKGDTSKALISARKALEIDIESPEAHNLLGYIRAMDGELEDALISYRQAMVLDEEYLDPIFNTAEILAQPDADPQEAIRLLRNVSEMLEGPEVAEAILLEVDALLNLGKIEEAKARLNDIEDIELLPSCYMVFIARVMYEMGDLEGANACLKKAIENDPSNGDAWYYTGLIYRDQGLRIESVKAFVKANEADDALPGLPWAKHIEPTESLVEKAIALLNEEYRNFLIDTEIVVLEAPTRQQIERELDPRQAVFAEGIDPEKGVFKRLWIFSRNFLRARFLPGDAAFELKKMIENEIFPPSSAD